MQEFFQGGANLGYGQKRSLCEVLHPTLARGGGGENDTRGGKFPSPPLKYSPDLHLVMHIVIEGPDLKEVNFNPVQRSEPSHSIIII